jgi:multidrug efflux pump subunit AcrA (membrane-fusion protein)
MKKIFGLVIVGIAVAALLFLPQTVAGSQDASESAGKPGTVPQGSLNGMTLGENEIQKESVFSVRTAKAERRNLEAYIEVNGNIVASNQVAVIPDVGGKVVSMSVSLGDTVKKGEVIAQVDPSRPGQVYSLSPVTAPVSGIVVTNPAAVGSTVTVSTAIMTIASGGNIQVEAEIPEREIGQLRKGLKASINLEAFPGKVFTASVSTVSPVVDPVARTKKIILEFDKKDSRISSGMFANVRLSTRSYQNVVSIPAVALVNVRGVAGVYVVTGDTVTFVETETGVTVDAETEIKTPLNEGDIVVTQGQQFLSNNARVKIIGESI